MCIFTTDELCSFVAIGNHGLPRRCIYKMHLCCWKGQAILNDVSRVGLTFISVWIIFMITDHFMLPVILSVPPVIIICQDFVVVTSVWFDQFSIDFTAFRVSVFMCGVQLCSLNLWKELLHMCKSCHLSIIQILWMLILCEETVMMERSFFPLMYVCVHVATCLFHVWSGGLHPTGKVTATVQGYAVITISRNNVL